MKFSDWYPIEKYLFFDSFPDLKNLDKTESRHHLLYVLFRYFPNSCRKNMMENTKLLHHKTNLTIRLFRCENFLFVVKRKYIFQNNDFTCMIALLAINKICKISPHFLFTYYEDIDEGGAHVRTIMDYSSGVTFYKFLKIFLKNPKETDFEIFLGLFYQLLFALEYAQRVCLFTHYDLHLQNIIVESNETPVDISYQLFNKKYTLKNQLYKIRIIDYEFSSVCINDKIISNLYETIFQHGYLGIYFPAVDFFRVSMTLRSFLDGSDSLSKDVRVFLDFLFQNLFHFTLDDSFEHFLKTRPKHYLNMTVSKQIYYCPFDIILFLESHDHILSKKFGKKSILPFQIKNDFVVDNFIQISNKKNKMDYEYPILVLDSIPTLHNSLHTLKSFLKTHEVLYEKLKKLRCTRSICLGFPLHFEKWFRVLSSLDQILCFREKFPEFHVDLQYIAFSKN